MLVRKHAQTYFFAAIFLAVLVLNAAMFWPFAGAVVLALTLYVVFNPLYFRLRKVMGNRSGWAALATVVLVFLIIVAPLAFFGVVAFRETSVLYSVFREGGGEGYIGNLNRLVNSKLQTVWPGFSFDVQSVVARVVNFLVENVAGIFSSISNAVFSLFLALMALYYLFKEGGKMRAALKNLSPLADEHDENILAKMSRAVNAVIKGSILVAVIQGVLTGLGFLVFGLPNPALWGAVAVISALIPMVGTALVLGPAVVYLVVVKSAGAALGLLLWGVVIVGGVDNLLRPKLFERGINIHPFFILISVLGGLKFFGAVGFLLGPLLLSLLFALLDIYKREFKGTE